MKKEEKKQPVDFIKRVKPERKEFNKFLNLCKRHKAITISSSIGIVIVILIIVAVIVVMISTPQEEVSANTADDNAIIADEAEEQPEQDITLQADTNGLEDGTEVAVIKNDDGTIDVIAKDDPQFAEKTAGKNYSTGTIGNGGVNLKTKDNDLITIASKPQEEQKNNVKVENNTTPDTTVTEEPSQPETPATTPSTGGSSSSGTSTSKPSSGSGSSTSKPSGSTGGSSGSSSKPSGGSSTSTGGGSSSSSSGSSSSGGSSSSSGQYAPFTVYKTVHRTDKENQAIAWIQDELVKVGDSQNATVKHASNPPSGRTYSTFSEVNARHKVSGGAYGTVYVYVEDVYMSDSAGNPTSSPADCAMYIWIVA